MFRDTGFGEVDVDLDFSGIGVLKATLWNFDFDDFAGNKYRGLKPQHIEFLKERVVPLLENHAGQIWMIGSASRIGTAGWNKELSQNRVITVASYLAQMGIGGEQVQTDAIGNTHTAKHEQDDDHDRSVTLWVLPKIYFEPIVKPKLPRHVPPKPKVSRHFKIALAMALDVSLGLKAGAVLKRVVKGRIGAGVAIAGMAWIIVDTENHLRCTYVYAAIGLGVSLSMPWGNISGTTHGDWTSFTTEKPISCSQFGNTMRFTTIGIGSKSVNWALIETPPGVSDVYINVSTGTTPGGGAATYPAHLSTFVPLESPHPFNGP
jgi:hypothetical protein